MSTWARLVRFIPESGGPVLLGEPVDADIDVGLAMYTGEVVEVEVFDGCSVLAPGVRTGTRAKVGRLLSPVSHAEVGTIRCVGLNYATHAREVGLPMPEVPSVFLKPAQALTGPHPDPICIPKAFVNDNAADWESEMALIIGKSCKDVREEDAMEYLLGYTAANDISSRIAQFAQSQWCYSKGFDGACPVGPTVVNRSVMADLSGVSISGSLNGEVVQRSTMADLIFSVPRIISFLSRGTTLPAGTLILTGTPPGVGWGANPRRVLADGDVFQVTISHGVGTLVNQVVFERW